ncbi:undecaprenyl/decaprenyl-phosphate alpha-N-acetylglucosaminyl 1-phosphate transferase [Myxococcota bacterium]|nr:undecaprenyl/decaprenyl-phosphate alpha-N-acetylglucosaminyl 1-phosphate transferase [Myxococcota bacterium]
MSVVALDPYYALPSVLMAAVVAAVATPMAARLAFYLRIEDRPGDRKVNTRQGIPLLGGLAVAMGAFAGLLGFFLAGSISPSDENKVLGYVTGSVVLILMGVWDDRFYLNAWQKLPIQIGCALLVIGCGFRIDYLTDPLMLTTYQLPAWISWPISLLWIVAVTNAMNLIDGLDGLSAGTGAIMGLALAVICWQSGQMMGVVIGLSLMGGLLGFLPSNFPPARIFLGDAGALFIGFSLSLASIQGYRKTALLTLVVPLIALAVPLLDTGLSIIRRIRMGKGIFDADKMHMHHRLLEREGSQRRAVLWLYLQTACFSLIAISFSQLSPLVAGLLLIVVFALTIRMLRNMGLFEVQGESCEEAEVSELSNGKAHE